MGMWRERDVRTLLSIHRLEESPFLRYTLHYTQGLKEAKGEMVGLERNMPFPISRLLAGTVRKRPSKFSAAKKVLEFERV